MAIEIERETVVGREEEIKKKKRKVADVEGVVEIESVEGLLNATAKIIKLTVAGVKESAAIRIE
jgi:hypothetical protein